MEATEIDHKTKAGESRGKGSNVAYASRTACAELVRKRINKKHVIFTITDSDSAIPELYIRHVEKSLSESEDPYSTICSPPIFFSRNALHVPAAVRVTDIMWSIMVMQNLNNRKGLAFPCSTYSLSMVKKKIEQVGFWDTHKDAIGEDLHMWLKCFFKTGGVSRTIPIYVPINLTNVQTTGYISNIYARWVQAKRHYNGVADVAYSLKSAFGNGNQVSDSKSIFGSKESCFMSCSFLDKLTVVFHVLEAHMIPATSGWIMFVAIPFTQLLISTYSPLSDYFPSSIPLLMCAILYEGLHKIVDLDLFKKSSNETRTWRNYTDYAWLPVSAWLFLTLPSTAACVRRLTNWEEKYVVAEKIFSEELEC